MAKDSMFSNAGGLAGFILGRAGVIPIKRDSADREGIKRGVHHLKHGEVICIFPEGTRRGKTDYPISLHTGAAFMARMANVPIIPCGITGAGKICPGKGIHFPRVSVTYGKPVCESDFSMFPRNDRLDAMTWYVMREVHALAEGIAPEEVDMDGLYPGSRNFSAEFVGFVPASWAEEGEEVAGAHHTKDNDA